MTRRELFLLGRRLLVLIMGGGFLGGCGWLRLGRSFHSRLAYLMAYLLYDNNIPSHSIADITRHVQRTINGSLKKQIENEILSKINTINFEALSTEDKRAAFENIVPQLVQYQEILDIVDHYLQEERVLEYLDYPDLPGEYGECGRLIVENSVWDRYYPPPG